MTIQIYRKQITKYTKEQSSIYLRNAQFVLNNAGFKFKFWSFSKMSQVLKIKVTDKKKKTTTKKTNFILTGRTQKQMLLFDTTYVKCKNLTSSC